MAAGAFIVLLAITYQQPYLPGKFYILYYLTMYYFDYRLKRQKLNIPNDARQPCTPKRKKMQ
jgi:hypothetical protein